MSVRQTKHFSPEVDKKITCPCCGEGTLEVGLFILLEELRQHFGHPILLHSGARCTTYNPTIKGASKKSEHLINDFGEVSAVDISVQSVSTKQLYTYLKERPYANLLGLGYYPKRGFVHVDLRGYGARW